MLYLGIVIGLLIGALLMHIKNKKVLDVFSNNLHETQEKLKLVKSQLYKRRTSYKRKSPNSQSNGKKAIKKSPRKKTTANSKGTSIK